MTVGRCLKVRERVKDCMAGGGRPCRLYVAFRAYPILFKIHMTPRPRRGCVTIGLLGPQNTPPKLLPGAQAN